jgi:hypothetical protein
MSVTIDLPPDVEASLAAQAAAHGVPLAEHLRRLLVAEASGSGSRGTSEERVKLRRDADEATSRESMDSERDENGALAAELLALGRDCAARLNEPWRSADHAELLYDERGLPR